MSARREEAYYTSNIAKNVLSERADIMNYVPTKIAKNVLSERADIMNYVPTKGIFAVCGK